jgi:hypothetical protein
MKHTLPFLVYKLILVVIFMMTYQSGYACANRGNIKVDTSRCDINRAKLWLVNHTTTAGTQYFWQSSNDGGLNWATISTNSGRDTQLVTTILGRRYRCLSICAGVPAYSDTIAISLQNRTITVDQVFCSGTAGGNDSLLLKAAPFTTATDTALLRILDGRYLQLMVFYGII